MRKVLLALFLSFSLAGCGGALLVHDPATQAQATNPVQVAQDAIDQAYATHAAITATLLQNYRDKVLTKQVKDDYARLAGNILKDIDTADDLLGKGELGAAQAQIKLVNKALALLQANLAASIARKGGN